MKAIRGFTLVELLVAMTLFSFTLVMIFSGLHSASRNWEAGEKQIGMNDEQRLALTFLQRYISQAVPLSLVDGREFKLLFKGERDAIHFISNLPAHRNGGGLYSLSLLLTQEALQQNLVLKYMAVNPDKDFFNQTHADETASQVLLPDIEGIEFAYYGSEQPNEEPDWSNHWEAKERLPLLVRIRIYAAKPELYIPELLIPIRNQAIKGGPEFLLNISKSSLSI